jgi:branched-chain amino acid transport system substrate-binding protein
MPRFTLSRRALGAAALVTVARPAFAQPAPIRIGELNSYSRMAAFAVPYRNAMQQAQDAVNAAGGVMGGRRIEFVFRDDGATPGDAVRVAEELLTRENVAFLAGTFLSNVGLAVSDFANQRKRLFLATEPLTDALTMAQGNRYTWRLRPSTFMQTRMLVEAIRGRNVRRWAIVAPNYEYGQSAAANFKRLLPAAIPGAEIVAEQFPALGRVDAGATVGALGQARPDGIFNVLFGADLTAFVREGNTRGLFERRTVVSLLTGEPEYMIPLGEETPEGWIVTGAPGLCGSLSRALQRHAAQGLAARLRDRAGHREPAQQGEHPGQRSADQRARGPAVGYGGGAGGDARDRPPGHHGHLGGRDDAAWPPGHDAQHPLRRRRRLHVPRE